MDYSKELRKKEAQARLAQASTGGNKPGSLADQINFGGKNKK